MKQDVRRRAFLVVMDGCGIGGAPDADDFCHNGISDAGANTLGHTAAACAARAAEKGARAGPLHLPNLTALGLFKAERLADGKGAPTTPMTAGPPAPTTHDAFYGAATAQAPGKDTPSGHWELAGLRLDRPWHLFGDTCPVFPDYLTRAAARIAGTPAILGNCRASGTEIIARLGKKHLRTGWPICYTSADSVFQIAAHEEHFGLDRLLAMCRTLAPTVHAMNVCRVIARPFIGDGDKGFHRTLNRRDFAASPPGPTLCDWTQSAGGKVLGIGKIRDIFAGQGIDATATGDDNQLVKHLLRAIDSMPDGSLTFANFIEFDSLYGHRRDVSGFARHLEWFDQAIGQVVPRLREGDLLFITADHGNDPTWQGTDHTRERVPVLVVGGNEPGNRPAGVPPRSLGLVDFVDVAASLAAWLRLPEGGTGRNIVPE